MGLLRHLNRRNARSPATQRLGALACAPAIRLESPVQTLAAQDPGSGMGVLSGLMPVMPARLFSASIAPTETFDDAGLIDRIVASYRLAVATPVGSTESMWLTGEMFELRRSVHEQIMSDDPAAAGALLRDPGETDLFYGFEDNCSHQRAQPAYTQIDSVAATQFDQLTVLAECVAACRVTHPHQPPGEMIVTEIRDLLASLDAVFGFKIEFPNPFPGECGIETGRGILTYRAVHALYQAWRIRQVTRDAAAPRVLEIGAGLGRTAYYAWQFGIRDYTIVDLPLTLVAQANFLGRTVGTSSLRLHGESGSGHIRLMPPQEFLAMSDSYDLALNVDSMTEMARETAQTYFDHIDRRAHVFLSINHEGNSFRACDLFAHRRHSRTPYWLRPGYVEEEVMTGRRTSL
jgi:hypothetical protein